MHKNKPISIVSFWLRLVAVLFVLAVQTLSAQPAAARSSAPARASAAASVQADMPNTGLLQFKAAGHVIGFLTNKVYMAALDHALSLEFVGSAGVTPRASGEKSGGPADGARGAPRMGTVTYSEVWPGISITYQAAADGIVESTYTLAPGADPAQMRLRYNSPVKLLPGGSLRFGLRSTQGALEEAAPLGWQVIDGQRRAVQVEFVVSQGNVVSFRVGAHDPRYGLTIDPTYQWHTFFGSNAGLDSGNAVAVDASGNVYVAGSSYVDFKGDGGTAPLHAFSGKNDIVVVKLTPSGGYLWHSFYGSAGSDEAYGIAVRPDGNVAVTGYSSAAWNAPVYPLNGHSNTSNNAFVLLLTGAGVYQWHAFYGSSDYADGTYGTAVASDQWNNVYVVGYSSMGWFTYDPYPLPPNHAHTSGYNPDIFVLKLFASGTYSWYTFYGSPFMDYGMGIAVDSNGSSYITGISSGNWLGDANKNPLHPYSGGNGDLTVLKLGSTGVYQWHTFYGSSSGFAIGNAVTISKNGQDVIVTGKTTADWSGLPAPKHVFTGGDDIVVLKINSSGVYQWHTFFGGAKGSDVGRGVSLDLAGSVYVTGYSTESWAIGFNNPLHPHARSGEDIVVVKMNSSGGYLWHTFYGSNSDDTGAGIAVFQPDIQSPPNVSIAGSGGYNWNGDNSAAPKHPHGDSYDITALLLNDAGTYQWHTFYGSQVLDLGLGMAVDSTGAMYITGISYGTWMGPQNQDPLHPFNFGDGNHGDIAVVKVDSNGAYQWHTFYGSAGDDFGTAAALDGKGHLFITGYSDATWQGDGNTSPAHSSTGGSSITLLELTTDGAYVWHTFYGASIDQGTSLAFDNSGNLFVAGTSFGAWLGDANKQPLHAFTGTNPNLFVMKFGPNKDFQWHTFYPGGASAMAVDGKGNLYFTGMSAGGWTGVPAPLHPYSGVKSDNFVLKLNNAGAYQWHTFYGSNGNYDDYAQGLAVNAAGDVYVVGTSGMATGWLGDGGAQPLHPHNSGADLFVLKLDTNGAYQWHTFYGGPAANVYSQGNTAALDPAGNVYVTGEANGAWTGPDSIDPLRAYTGGMDDFILALTSSGAYRWHTFYGSTGDDRVHAAIIQDNILYTAGEAGGPWQVDGGAAPLNAYSDGQDIFGMKMIISHAIFLPFAIR